ncbi:uncharacterized protein LOC133918306 isoform X1 [Phragmites australis]|uniref:uncharacterized protein LOC133918306 isoform X1 n=1 Tax=Phragmites australis TaxID=29695 RepID=UPI002D7878E6|nr:uncharacterized protein LOC133918306 isoform X1 [Phragmites australis]
MPTTCSTPVHLRRPSMPGSRPFRNLRSVAVATGDGALNVHGAVERDPAESEHGGWFCSPRRGADTMPSGCRTAPRRATPYSHDSSPWKVSELNRAKRGTGWKIESTFAFGIMPIVLAFRTMVVYHHLLKMAHWGLTSVGYMNTRAKKGGACPRIFNPVK